MLVDVRHTVLEQLLKRKLKVRAHDPPPAAPWSLPLHFYSGFPVQRARVLNGTEAVRRLHNSLLRIHYTDVASVPVKHNTAPQIQRFQHGGRGRQMAHFDSHVQRGAVDERGQFIVIVPAMLQHVTSRVIQEYNSTSIIYKC